MDITGIIKNELKTQAAAILKMADRLDASALQQAYQFLADCKGKVVLTGLGKSGIIARKISATLASTGTASIFLHAAEGLHGDLGMVQSADVVIAVSKSGAGSELISIIPFLKFVKTPLIAFTGNASSPLAEAAHVALDCSVPQDSEPLGMIPTSSTTVALALGDAFAIALLTGRNFSLQDFARFHPGGSIGKQLLLKVQDLMHTNEDLPRVNSDAQMDEAILSMTSGKLGCTAVTDGDGKLLGIVTDGDLRRQLQIHPQGLLQLSVTQCMTAHPKRLKPSDLALAALKLMQEHSITMLPVVDDDDKVVGMLHMHDLIRAGVVSQTLSG
ncbi:MAG: KpsF/GutQ family sugar-phosphate isomerase [Candidatus Cloacimonetes bacterium]|nr:KpsF/GutQ family sugar-phosphate isomerase [Candidatus Cloacimonadota bacterium]